MGIGTNSNEEICGLVVVNEEKCTQCWLCVELCPLHALEKDARTPKQVGVCTLCLGCMAVCEPRAIKLEPISCSTLHELVEGRRSL